MEEEEEEEEGDPARLYCTASADTVDLDGEPGSHEYTVEGEGLRVGVPLRLVEAWSRRGRVLSECASFQPLYKFLGSCRSPGSGVWPYWYEGTPDMKLVSAYVEPVPSGEYRF